MLSTIYRQTRAVDVAHSNQHYCCISLAGGSRLLAASSLPDSSAFGPLPCSLEQADTGGGSSVKLGMPCTTCLHPTCKHSPAQQGVLACPECAVGLLVLDPVSAPKWRLDCSRCSFMIYLPKDLHDAKVTKERCEVGCWLRCRQS